MIKCLISKYSDSVYGHIVYGLAALYSYCFVENIFIIYIYIVFYIMYDRKFDTTLKRSEKHLRGIQVQVTLYYPYPPYL